MKRKKKIGVLTGGGDCPGLNAVIRAVAKTAINEHNMDVVGFLDGYEGLVEERVKILSYLSVSGILQQGGTILGTSNKANPFDWSIEVGGKLISQDLSDDAVAVYEKLGLDAIVAIGGDGTLSIANSLMEKGMKVVGVPKTIDNDIVGTDYTFGFNSAFTIAAEALDKIHTTAQSHHRVMVVEVMGRYAGWLALYSGVAAGGDIILLPEMPYDINKILETVEFRGKTGRRFTIVVVAEGAYPKGGEVVVKKMVKGSHDPIRLGGVGLQLANEIEEKTGIESRVTVLGHLLRGGTPTPFDRVLATRYGVRALEEVVKNNFGQMVALQGNEIVAIPIEEVANKTKYVPKDSPMIRIAESVGTHFGV
ncbi:MAG: ATP-dependent 6-phosphofructokinase [Calditrichia bacterium]|nr:ATP-dependent 6-phosphofructokinase [Calditrichia bacterium]